MAVDGWKHPFTSEDHRESRAVGVHVQFFFQGLRFVEMYAHAAEYGCTSFS